MQEILSKKTVKRKHTQPINFHHHHKQDAWLKCPGFVLFCFFLYSVCLFGVTRDYSKHFRELLTFNCNSYTLAKKQNKNQLKFTHVSVSEFPGRAFTHQNEVPKPLFPGNKRTNVTLKYHL